MLVSLPALGEGETQASGVALVVGATACYGLSINIAAPIQQKYGSLPLMMWMLSLASLWCVPYAVVGLADERLDDVRTATFAWGSLLAVLAAGLLGTGLAYVIMGTLVGRVGGPRASFITYVIPLVALLLGVLFKDDVVEAVSVVGVGLILAGAFLASRKEVGCSCRGEVEGRPEGRVVSEGEMPVASGGEEQP